MAPLSRPACVLRPSARAGLVSAEQQSGWAHLRESPSDRPQRCRSRRGNHGAPASAHGCAVLGAVIRRRHGRLRFFQRKRLKEGRRGFQQQKSPSRGPDALLNDGLKRPIITRHVNAQSVAVFLRHAWDTQIPRYSSITWPRACDCASHGSSNTPCMRQDRHTMDMNKKKLPADK